MESETMPVPIERVTHDENCQESSRFSGMRLTVESAEYDDCDCDCDDGNIDDY